MSGMLQEGDLSGMNPAKRPAHHGGYTTEITQERYELEGGIQGNSPGVAPTSVYLLLPVESMRLQGPKEGCNSYCITVLVLRQDCCSFKRN